ncbi:dihydroorotase [Vibrio sp. 99-8-1]|uniref:dihydroorotase n=1 Tax=Vibrio sp. 99-8-1 TaxID=2607602 RepID=UPI0014938136|nr:dihydroorotase [Vibrio sp. 99-8-1]NOI66034.1 dihydroorotase [Vibrio sp. 99-8-1]
MTTLTITRPDDWHVHLRDGAVLKDTVADISRYNGRAIVMPNTIPPATTTELALQYYQRIKAHNTSAHFEPLMTLYLTDNTTAEEILKAKATGKIVAAKLYPAGATTNSDSGVTDIDKLAPVLKAMEECGMLLLIHGEVTDHGVDIFDREKVFLDQVLAPIVTQYSQLKIVVEHITTSNAVEFVKSASDNVAATITAHHLLYNRNHMLVGGIRPHFYCLPILKRGSHQQALIEAATSGNKKFFAGTDSAPHTRGNKETTCGCAGSYTAHAALELYAEVFDKENKLENLEAFVSFNGADYYGLPRNTGSVTLTKEAWPVPLSLPFGNDEVVPVKAGENIEWTVSDTDA